MTRSLPDPSLAHFDPEIDRTLTHIRQAQCRLAFVNSKLGSLEEHTNLPSHSNRDSHSSNNEETLYSSVGSTEVSLNESGDSTMAEPPCRITLKEARALDINLQPIQIRSGTKLDEIGVVPTSWRKRRGSGSDKSWGRKHCREGEELLNIKEPKRNNLLEEPAQIFFPILAKKAKKHEGLDPNVVEIFKNVKVTVPLFQAIQQVPKYVKFLKDVCNHKDKIGELNKNPINDFISSVLPKKCNDPGLCLVTCVIGGMEFMDCMCDLGACVSIMPLPIYKKLNLSLLKRSGARFVLADKSIVSVVGIVENLLINIQGLIFSVDFHILETPPIDSDKPSSILLGRPFLKTSRFKLDAHSRAYSFESDGRIVKFTLDGSKKPTFEVYSILGCDLIEEKVIESSEEQEEDKNTKELEIFLFGEAPSHQ
ncbi:uncharacterized protein LOC107484634 [Arachis duranensis]|uniref:Uncharacterized protein LOC107484634 n=1 Tax=Arachis duranensis TaxID=130453 RepID=A0A6P4D1V7_ARADU|nr:uncharacterized protein LOC107484634 [Arachis duranensis]